MKAEGDIRELLRQSPDFSFENNLFYQRGLDHPSKFETVYLSIRRAEERLYADEIVRMLPRIPPTHPAAKEWRIRMSTSGKLLRYLQEACQNRQPAILEIGCGNGWLSNYLATVPNSCVLGIDINETELRQAARAFAGNEKISFAYADVLTSMIPDQIFDYIILAATLPYFGNLDLLLARLRQLMRRKGEIHILDSPVYSPKEIYHAKLRSEKHFTLHNSELGGFYHYHSWDAFRNHPHDVLYDPRSLSTKALSLIYPMSPFPWIRLHKT